MPPLTPEHLEHAEHVFTRDQGKQDHRPHPQRAHPVELREIAAVRLDPLVRRLGDVGARAPQHVHHPGR